MLKWASVPRNKEGSVDTDTLREFWRCNSCASRGQPGQAVALLRSLLRSEGFAWSGSAAPPATDEGCPIAASADSGSANFEHFNEALQ